LQTGVRRKGASVLFWWAYSGQVQAKVSIRKPLLQRPRTPRPPFRHIRAVNKVDHRSKER
jgi:hypothetical protein